MATADSISEISASIIPRDPGLLVLLAGMTPEQLEDVLANLTSSYPAEGLIVATPDVVPAESWPNLRVVPIPETVASWTLTPADFVNAYQLAGQNNARAILILGPGAASLRPSALRELGDAVIDATTDLALPCYDLPPHGGLANSAILIHSHARCFHRKHGFRWPSILVSRSAWLSGLPSLRNVLPRSTRAMRCFGPIMKPQSPDSR